MIQKQMRVSMAVTLGMLFMMLAFGRGRLAPFYDHVGTASAEFAADAAVAVDGVAAAIVENVTRGIETPASVSNETSRAGRPMTPTTNASSGGAEESAHDAVAAEPAPPDPEAVRDSAAAEVTALGPLHDELIGVLGAIQEAQTDSWEKRKAGDRVTMARIAKRTQMRDLRLFIATKQPEWSVRSARRSAASARARLDHDIAEARETLAKLRGR